MQQFEPKPNSYHLCFRNDCFHAFFKIVDRNAVFRDGVLLATSKRTAASGARWERKTRAA